MLLRSIFCFSKPSSLYPLIHLTCLNLFSVSKSLFFFLFRFGFESKMCLDHKLSKIETVPFIVSLF